MKNYVVRWTRDRYDQKEGSYATQGMGYGPRGNAVDINDAYVFNTRMNRRGAMHLLTIEQRENRGVEVVFVNLVPK